MPPTMEPDMNKEPTKKKLSYQPSILGRKGDPRMHLAVQFRMADPKLSLLEALRKGGFVFTADANGSITDSDNVGLGQRKNQLSRRLRLQKQEVKKESSQSGGSSCGDNDDQRDDSYPIASLFHTAALEGMAVHVPVDNIASVAAIGMIDNHSAQPPGTIAIGTKRKMPSSPDGQIVEDDSKLIGALGLFRADVASLFKKSMLTAGYQITQTEECDEDYLNFVEKALEGESKRIHRIRSRLKPASIKFAAGIQASGEDGCSHHEHAQAQAQTQTQTHAHSHAHQHEHEHAHSQSSDNDREKRQCLHSRHFHRLEGKCGHKAIVHKPAGGNPHIDFVVNGKVECYEGCEPMKDSASFWPSTLRNREADNLQNQNDNGEVNNVDQGQQCEENCKLPAVDPKVLDLKDLDFNGGEWYFNSEEDHSKSCDDIPAMWNLFKLSES